MEVVEGDDPKYIYGQSFGYGDILEKGKIPNNMVYPNFEAGEINQEGTWAGTVESDTPVSYTHLDVYKRQEEKLLGQSH